jgi:hypothetical protein
MGESQIIKCPHCGKEIVLTAKALESDPDQIEVKYSMKSTAKKKTK